MSAIIAIDVFFIGLGFMGGGVTLAAATEQSARSHLPRWFTIALLSLTALSLIGGATLVTWSVW